MARHTDNSNDNEQNNNNTKYPLDRPHTGPVVRRPHRETLASRPIRPIDPADVPTQRLPDRDTPPAPVHRQPVVSHPPTVPHVYIKEGGRNNLHTIYNLTQHAFTNVSGFYSVEADINKYGEIVLYSVDVGGKWRSQPFYLTHKAVRELIRADADACRYYHFADDDDEGA